MRDIAQDWICDLKMNLEKCHDDLLALLVRRYSVAIWLVNLGCGETRPCSSVRLCSGAKLKSTGVPCSMKVVAADT